MKLTSNQFIVLESIFINVVIPITDIDKYFNLVNAMKNVQQLEDSSVELDISPMDLELLFPFILDSDFKVKDINFVLDFLKTIGLMIGDNSGK